MLMAKISPYAIKRQRCTIFCLCSVSFCNKKFFSTYQAEQTDLEGKSRNLLVTISEKLDLLFRTAHKKHVL